MRMRAGVLSLALLGSVALASPALATNEKYRFDVPATAKAGTTLTGIKGYCAGDGSPSVLSDAFVGGKARVKGPDFFTAEADIVDEPGYYFVYMVCAGGLAMTDDVTVTS